jgi:thiosulfate/3-mercaptopyruvate sulfurtransferase
MERGRRRAGERARPSGAAAALVALASVLWSGSGCAPDGSPPAGVDPDRVGGAAGVRADMLVSTASLGERLGREDLVVLHVAAQRDGYDSGHIPGARFVAVSELAVPRAGVPNEFPSLDDLTALARRLGIDERSRVVCYDEAAGLLAARAYVALDVLGLGDRAALLDGHLQAWRAEGRPLETAAPAVTPSSFAPRPRPGLVVPLAEMRDLAARAAGPGAPIALLDARPEAQFTGAEAGEGVRRPGHIPGAANLFWMKALEGPDRPVLRSPEELRRQFADAGIVAGDEVVTYCRTGMQAAHSYFVARYLGHDVRLYDGSFIEWSAVPGAPVAGP